MKRSFWEYKPIKTHVSKHIYVCLSIYLSLSPYIIIYIIYMKHMLHILVLKVKSTITAYVMCFIKVFYKIKSSEAHYTIA